MKYYIDEYYIMMGTKYSYDYATGSGDRVVPAGYSFNIL
jgi:hypothetical protein